MSYTGKTARTHSLSIGVLSVGLVIALSSPASALPPGGGSPDSTFGLNGTVVTDVTGKGKLDEASDVVVQPDGRIVAVGSVVVWTPEGEEEEGQPDHDFALARYNPDGTLDTTFGSGGMVRSDLSRSGSRDEAEAVALQPDGKIVVAGTSDRDVETLSDFALVRYNSDGTLDTTFGTDGLVLTDMGRIDAAEALAVGSDGRIVVVGSSDVRGGSDFDFALARYNSDGTLDKRFGVSGKVLTAFGSTRTFDVANAVAVAPGGRIIVAGHSDAGASTDFAVARYNRNGKLDTTFGTGGKVLTDVGGDQGSDAARSIAVQPNGRVVVAGSAGGFGLVRYDRGGKLDASFGTGGRVVTALTGLAYAVAIAPNGKILVAGNSSPVLGGRDDDFALARYLRDGTPDTTFGSGGMVTTDFSGAGSYDVARAVSIQPNGMIVAAGHSNSRANWDDDFALARYLP